MLLAFVALLTLQPAAEAFCGFYVSGADASLYNDATQVVLMREGKRTVLSMQNSYEGPPSDFAMVVPVPTVIQKEDVKTLPKEVFQKIDTLSAPRLVEYWEQDPCYVEPEYEYKMSARRGDMMVPSSVMEMADKDYGVKIEAQFSVAEYDIVILSARDSGGLDAWLRKEKYNIPKGAETVLRPYVASGTKFFVAKVDADRVSYDHGRAVLSPLRVSYESEDFSLPIRLGLLNSKGEQDLLVHVLARNQRYEVANYPNRTIPTNIVVYDSVREGFGDFYDSLYSEARKAGGGAVITEYSWAAGSCDPCPGPTLDQSDILTLGGDVTGVDTPWDVVLTRLHHRYTAESLGEDLVFRAAPPIVGGRGMPDTEGKMAERESEPAGMNNFQGRYIILHPWEGAIACKSPVRGRWGGPPNGGSGTRTTESRLGGAAPKAADLATLVTVEVPSIGLSPRAASAAPATLQEAPAPLREVPATGPSDDDTFDDKGAGPCGTAPAAGGLASLLALVALLFAGGRRNKLRS